MPQGRLGRFQGPPLAPLGSEDEGKCRMHSHDALLRRRFAQQPCSKCQNRGLPETLLVLVRRPRTWVVMATCANCHHRGLYLISAPRARSAPVSDRDVTEMHAFLETFNGDFTSLFHGGSSGSMAVE
jgi:hypothetical protein